MLRILLGCTTISLFDAFAAQPEWTIPLDAAPLSPTLYPDAKAPTGLVLAAGSSLWRIGGHGEAIWQVDLGADAASPPAVADLDGDGSADIVCATADFRVVCHSADGRPQWSRRLEGPLTGIKAAAIADVVADRPGLEVVFGFDDGWLYCLASNGDIVWRFYGEPSQVSPAALADVDGDGAADVFYGTDDGTIYSLDGSGQVRWRTRAGGVYGRSAPVVADLARDGRPELLMTHSNVGTETRMLALDARTGIETWRTGTFMQGYVSNAAVDLDRDGVLEVLHGDKGNVVYCTNADGSERWHRELAGRGVFFAPAVADLDGDGDIEIAFGIRDAVAPNKTSVYVLNSRGEIESELQTGSSANASPAVGDIDGDGVAELIVASTGPNQVQAYAFGGNGPVLWPSMRGNSAMTGSRDARAGGSLPLDSPTDALSLANVQIDDPEAYWGRNSLKVSWDDPMPAPGFVETRAGVSNGITHTMIAEFPAGAQAGTAVFWCSSDEPLDVQVRIFTANSPIPQWHFRQTIHPHPAEFCRLDEIESHVASALDAAASCNASGLGLRQQVLLLQAAQHDLTDSPLSPILRSERAMDLRIHARSLDARAQTLGRRWSHGAASTLLIWPDDNPWDAFGPDDIPDADRLGAPLRVEAFQDEFEDVALTLLNMSDRSVTVRCTFAEPAVQGGRPPDEPELATHVTLRRAVRVPGQLQMFVNDALPEMDLSRTLVLPPGEAQQVWLVVDTHGMTAGAHELTLYVGSLEPIPEIIAVPVEIDVWPVPLPEGVYAQMNWVGTDTRETSNQQLQDMLDHGISVAYGPHLPKLTVDAGGNPEDAVDWAEFDASLARLPAYFQLLFHGPLPVAWPEGSAPPKDSDAEATAFRHAITILRDHMRERGWDVDRWAFYPYDEPWNTGFTLVPALRTFCEKVKAVDPAVRT